MINPTIKHTFTSRFEGIERPHLRLEHTPGWHVEDAGDVEANTHFIFSSHQARYHLDFDVVESDGAPTSFGLLASGGDMPIVMSEDAQTLAEHTPELRKWFLDIATVIAWVREHDTTRKERA